MANPIFWMIMVFWIIATSYSDTKWPPMDLSKLQQHRNMDINIKYLLKIDLFRDIHDRYKNCEYQKRDIIMQFVKAIDRFLIECVFMALETHLYAQISSFLHRKFAQKMDTLDLDEIKDRIPRKYQIYLNNINKYNNYYTETNELWHLSIQNSIGIVRNNSIHSKKKTYSKIHLCIY